MGSRILGNSIHITNFYYFTRDLIFKRAYAAPRKKFYKHVYVSESNGGYEINLDKRKLKTPLGNLLKLPNEALATAVATEWDIQQEHIQLHNMHLTSLCNSAIDNPCNTSKEGLVASTMEYLDTDTLCYRSREPPDLALLQRTKWDPLINWFENRFDVKINVSEDVANIPVPEETIKIIKRHLMTFNRWPLTGIVFAVESLKSIILTLAVMHRFLDVNESVELARLEVIFQTEQWGNVDWSHDLELKQTTSRVAAAALFVYLNEETTSFSKKAALLK